MAVKREPFEGFFEEDFDTYLPEKRRSSEFNEDRLSIKHRLHSLGEMVSPRLKEAGLNLDFKTSLSHPYTYNKYSVDSQWVYFARKEKDRRALKKIFGAFLGKDLDMHYSHVILVLEIALEGIELGLKIHQHAWWDGQNAKNACRVPSRRQALTDELNKLNGFILSIHDWKREYVCGELRPEDIRNYMQYYTPGNHWLHLRMKLPRETAIPMGIEFADFASRALASLAPVYRFIEWRPDNSFAFDND